VVRLKKKPRQPESNKFVLTSTVPASRRSFAPLLLVVLISFFAFFPVLRNGFVNWDDDRYVTGNASIRSLNISEVFSRYFEGNYHPITLIVYSIEYQLFGFRPAGYHAVNLLLHLVNVVLVFRAILLLTRKREVALVGALLFGIHPLHVESVAWVSELKDLLYSAFFLGALICYLRFHDEKKKKLYFFSLGLFLLSLLSKALAVSLPGVLLLTDHFRGRKPSLSVWLEKVPFLALSVVFGVVAIFAQRSTPAMQFLDVYPLHQRLVFASYGFVMYLVKLVVPFSLSAVYPYPVQGGAVLPGWLYAYPLALLAVAALVLYSLRFSKEIFFGFAFFLTTVFFVLQLLPVGKAIMADRYVYIPSIGIFYLAGEAAWRWYRSGNIAITNHKVAGVVLAGALIVFFSATTYARCEVWRDSLTLWSDVISKEENAVIAYNKRGIVWAGQNNTDRAFQDFSKAIQLSSVEPQTYNSRGNIYVAQKKYDEALADYNKALELDPAYSFAYNGRGVLFIQQEKFTEAVSEFSKAIELQPRYAAAYFNRSIAQHSLEHQTSSCQDLQQAVSLAHPPAAQLYDQWCRKVSDKALP